MEIEPPALTVAAPACSEPSADAARARAERAEHAALAKEERAAFDVKDGAGALAALAEASACYAAAGNADGAE